MNMVGKWLSGVLVAALLLAACDGTGGGNSGNKFVDSKLLGTWESTDASLYSGRLVIGFDTITISGYGESPPRRNGTAGMIPNAPSGT
ncbi:MAG: hypothetical protein LBD48_01030 [Treponema sp.]|jgi:hypothetical protein|nr:hypothetical protein [Treponema sp.]